MHMGHPTPDHSDDQPVLIYDGECPVCSAYSRAAEIDEPKPLRRIDARSDDALVRLAEAAGLDLDEGMVLVYRGRHYHGAEALHLMARLAPNTGLKNRLNRLLFGNEAMSRLSYPVLRAGRNALLRLLGRGRIRDLRRHGAPPPSG
jgi:predicted DCC family thiol-disulfide oxidoreductase YuxK